MMQSAPKTFDARVQPNPFGPGPWITIVFPGPTSPSTCAHWTPLPHDILARVSTRITNEVRGINRVVYDISGKPPATIEWE